jgi:hypothetical protein
MLNIHFDPEDRLHPAPRFSLPTAGGGNISSADFYGQAALALLFLHGLDCAACRELAERLSACGTELAQAGAAALVILPQEPSQSLPLGLAAALDLDGSLRRAYASLMAEQLAREADVLFFALDEYGGPYAALVGEQPDAAGLQDLVDWMAYIGIQCPE